MRVRDNGQRQMKAKVADREKRKSKQPTEIKQCQSHRLRETNEETPPRRGTNIRLAGIVFAMITSSTHWLRKWICRHQYETRGRGPAHWLIAIRNNISRTIIFPADRRMGKAWDLQFTFDPRVSNWTSHHLAVDWRAGSQIQTSQKAPKAPQSSGRRQGDGAPQSSANKQQHSQIN